MKTIKIIISLLLVVSLLCGCSSSVFSEDNNDFPLDANIPDDEISDVLPDYDTDEDDEAVSPDEAIPPVDFEDDGGVVLDEPINYTSQTVESENDEFKLTLFNARDRYTSDDNIEIEATVSLLAGEELTVWSGDPILTFSLEGDTCFDDYQGSGMTMDILMPNTFTNIEDYFIPYSKSGGYSASDPYYAFYNDFFADRDSIKLPAGNYTVTAYLSYSMDPDDVIGTSRSLSATVSFTVSGKTLEDLGYFPQEPSPLPTEEEIVTEPEVAPDVEAPVSNTENSLLVQPLADVIYPELGEYPDYEDYENYNEFDTAWGLYNSNLRKLRNAEGRGEGVNAFTAETIKQFLGETNGENMVYSPLNVYLALGMLAETTDGETREQILNLMGEDSIDDLRRSAYALWCHNYSNGGSATTLLGSSFWLDESASLIGDCAENLAQHYFAEAYNCDIGSPEMLESYKAWLNEQTGGLLKDAVEETEFDPDAILILTSTMYYKATWGWEFNEHNTAPDEFTLNDGTTITCDFMNQVGESSIYTHDSFTAANKILGDGKMWFILPGEGTSCEDLVSSGAVSDLIVSGNGAQSKRVNLDLSLPKFDVQSNVSLNEQLKALGVTNAFDSDVSEFLVDANGYPVFVSNVKHVARVMVDETGCEGAAYTEIEVAAESEMEPEVLETVELTLDKPFIFAVTGAKGDILFVGIVNNPIAE